MEYDGIKIVGSDKFVKKTISALNLIKIKSKSDYSRIIKYLKCIKSSKSSGMDLEKGIFNVGKPTVFNSYSDWYSSTIVHDVHHYYLHNVKKFLWKEGNFQKHEELCVAKQVRFLKKIKASHELVEYCKTSIKTRYWELKKRDW